MTATKQKYYFRKGSAQPLVFIAGPCVIENYRTTFEIAKALTALASGLEVSFIFKASYDKANRTSLHSFRGPGLKEGLDILSQIKAELDIPILSDIHGVDEVEPAAQILDIIQVPAFLCRQTDLILEAAATHKPLNIKKGQFLAPWDVVNIAEKIASTGNDQICITERGTTFGYNNLVVDFRSIRIMQDLGVPVVLDVTHSVQLPGGNGKSSSGQSEFAPMLARAAVAAGASGIFLETHLDPDNALCDGPNSLDLIKVADLLPQLIAIKQTLTNCSASKR